MAKIYQKQYERRLLVVADKGSKTGLQIREPCLDRTSTIGSFAYCWYSLVCERTIVASIHRLQLLRKRKKSRMISPSSPPACQEPLVASNSEVHIRFTGTESDGQKQQSPGTEAGCNQSAAGIAGHVEGFETGQTSVVVQQTKDDGETWAFAYAQLARQLEYYFSEKNLSKDTYLQTLRQLNDGCVPVSILANFAMVKRLILSLTFVIDEEGRQAAVEEAARNHSERLAVSLIDTQTGLRVTDETELVSDSSHRIMAIGTMAGEPLVLDNSIPQPSPAVKTIVLRDVETGVTPEEIYELFNYEGFPPVSSIQPDVANCWYVARDEKVQVYKAMRRSSHSPLHIFSYTGL